MERTKPPQNETSAQRKKPGPKHGCTPEVIAQTRKFCLLGLVDWQLAEAFDVAEHTIGQWKREIPAFKQAVEDGRQHADSRVADMLLTVALGEYEQPAVKFFKIPRSKKIYDDEGNVIEEHTWHEIKTVHYTERFKPDTKAMIKWLNARQRETWAEHYKVDHNHKHAHLMVGDTNIHAVLDEVSNLEEYTDEELQLIAKLGLDKMSQQQDREIARQ